MSEIPPQTRGVIFDINGTLLNESSGSRIYERPGLAEAFGWLSKIGVKVGVVTSFSEDYAKRLLDSIEVLDFFDEAHILGAGSIRSVEVTGLVQQRVSGWRGLLGSTKEVKVIKSAYMLLEEKPNPAQVNYLLQDWQLDPSHALYVGDDDFFDAMCAKSAGVRFAHIRGIGGYTGDSPVSMYEFLIDNI